ncbi:LuxR C-terminal-related transcriptional regulator [Enterobacter hormaechei]
MVTYNLSMPFDNSTQTPCSILVIDKTPLVSFAIRKLVSATPQTNVVGHCTNGYDALSILRDARPNMVILDPDIPPVSGIDLVCRLRRYNPLLNVIIYANETFDLPINQYVNLNVNGIVFKNSDVNSLHYAIHAVNNGYAYFDNSPRSGASLLHYVQERRDTAELLNLPKLSRREKQILALISEGRKNKDIAEELCISIKTVESHRFNLMKKLDAHNVVSLIKWSKCYAPY